MRIRVFWSLSLLLLLASSFPDANAEEAPDMQALYDDAIQLMNAGNYEKACPMIERVMQLAPEGLGAKFTLAECYEEQGKLANALRTFVLVEKAAQEKGQNERSQKAAARADALRPKLAQLIFTGPQSLANTHGLRVEIDGVGIDSTQVTEPLYVDAGTHHLVAFAKNVRRTESTIDIAAGAVQEISIRELLALPKGASSLNSSSSVESWGNSRASTEPTWDPETNPSKRVPKQGFPVWQTVVGGVGLAAIGVGVAFKLDSVAAEQKLFEHCGKDLLCPRDSYYSPFDDNARKNRSFGLFLGMTGLGAVALGTATVGMIRWRTTKQTPKTGLIVRPSVSFTHGGVVFLGSF